MYRFLRDCHLLLGLFFCLFILMFGFSSLKFSHREWLPSQPTETRSTVAVDAERALTPRALARQLMEREGYRGGLHEVRDADGRIGFHISRMGTVHEVRYVRGASEAEVRSRVFPFVSMMTWMHATFGVRHEYALHNLWGVLMLATSVGLLLLGGTGIYLWFERNEHRRIGFALLLGNAILGGGLIALLWSG